MVFCAPLLAVLLLAALPAYAQMDEQAQPDHPSGHVLYAEFGGIGPLYSLNYELRLSKRWFARVGGTAVRAGSVRHRGGIAGIYRAAGHRGLEIGLSAQRFRHRRQPLCPVGCGDADAKRWSTQTGLYLSPSVGIRYQPFGSGRPFARFAFAPVVHAGALSGRAAGFAVLPMFAFALGGSF